MKKRVRGLILVGFAMVMVACNDVPESSCEVTADLQSSELQTQTRLQPRIHTLETQGLELLDSLAGKTLASVDLKLLERLYSQEWAVYEVISTVDADLSGWSQLQDALATHLQVIRQICSQCADSSALAADDARGERIARGLASATDALYVGAESLELDWVAKKALPPANDPLLERFFNSARQAVKEHLQLILLMLEQQGLNYQFVYLDELEQLEVL